MRLGRVADPRPNDIIRWYDSAASVRLRAPITAISKIMKQSNMSPLGAKFAESDEVLSSCVSPSLLLGLGNCLDAAHIHLQLLSGTMVSVLPHYCKRVGTSAGLGYSQERGKIIVPAPMLEKLRAVMGKAKQCKYGT